MVGLWIGFVADPGFQRALVDLIRGLSSRRLLDRLASSRRFSRKRELLDLGRVPGGLGCLDHAGLGVGERDLGAGKRSPRGVHHRPGDASSFNLGE